MRFGDWFKTLGGILLAIAVAFMVGGIIVAMGYPTAGVWVGLAIVGFGGWGMFKEQKSDSTCNSCGKNWTLKKVGYQDGEIQELHDRDSDGKLKIVHKWQRYNQWKCQNCGNETEVMVEKTRTV